MTDQDKQPLTLALDKLSSLIRQLNEEVAIIEQRLEPIASPLASGGSSADQGDGLMKEPNSPLTAKVKALCDLADDARTRLVVLQRSIEI